MSNSKASLATVYVKPGEADRLVAGHPWLYDNSVLRVTEGVPDGAVVQVKDHRRRFLGVGFYHSRSKIRVRLLSRERVTVDTAFFEARIRSALEVRRRHLPEASSFRVVHAEADFLSGLIVDKYEDVLVLQISSLGMEQRKGQIVEALQRIFRPRAILERSDATARKFEGLPMVEGVLAGEWPAPRLPQQSSAFQQRPGQVAELDPIGEGPRLPVRMHGLTFEVDFWTGHKTGLYLDQQTNYQLVARWARGAQVLDAFCFLGGFGLHAAQAGADRVHMIDQSETAVRAALRNAALNGLAARCTAETANVFDWLKARTRTQPSQKLAPSYDLIVLDPPSFTRTRASVPDALRGYKEIHVRALKLLRPGGVLATFCCSHHVDARTFLDVILSAAYDTRHILRRLATFSQGPDHPVIPMIPETEYLKGYAFELVR
ncbi:MAG: class I SAM-dependent rRNA methyltransferase [Verrucomicrobiota bacterium]|nr:class I SAM-dependent rRNA methyltransferase [Limisphaera sp.]MDW8381969.1 class I SAM-dependent rRNA methyltransferase [Verrucomicrobiota bacterium]